MNTCVGLGVSVEVFDGWKAERQQPAVGKLYLKVLLKELNHYIGGQVTDHNPTHHECTPKEYILTAATIAMLSKAWAVKSEIKGMMREQTKDFLLYLHVWNVKIRTALISIFFIWRTHSNLRVIHFDEICHIMPHLNRNYLSCPQNTSNLMPGPKWTEVNRGPRPLLIRRNVALLKWMTGKG